MHKLFSSLALMAALAAPVAAHADTISGFVSANGTDSFTPNTLTFDTAAVSGQLSGTFATYLTDGNPISFLPGALPYINGTNNIAIGGSVPLFTTSEKGATFTYNLATYSASYIVGSAATPGCTAGTCLDVTGTGFFTATGAVTGTSNTADFLFTTQYAPGMASPVITTFSASTSVPASPSAVPEPSALMLFGSGALGLAGLVSKKFKA